VKNIGITDQKQSQTLIRLFEYLIAYLILFEYRIAYLILFEYLIAYLILIANIWMVNLFVIIRGIAVHYVDNEHTPI